MENFMYGKALKEVGVTYLGNVKHSAKMNYSFKNGTLTYCLYLAPSTMAYGNRTTCPNDKYCKDFCLNGSGHNKADILSNGIENSAINIARIKKTKFFYEHREKFMQIIIHEINVAKKRAEREKLQFSVRLNGTSDLSLLTFKYNGKNILELFPDVQFYDYTKVANRFNLCKQYPNYDLTLSYNGHNWGDCREVLNNGGKVAVVFESEKMPKLFGGYKVENGNDDDMRYLNSPSSIIYLHYHPTANDYKYNTKTKKREYIQPKSEFIIKEQDIRCIY